MSPLTPAPDFDRWTVADIATPVIYRVPDHLTAAEVADDLASFDFDVALIDGTDLWIEAAAAASGGNRPAIELACPLSADTCLARDTPILDLASAFSSRPWRFVTDGATVVGIVTVADLERPAARLSMLAPILRFEEALARLIPSYEPEYLSKLGESQRAQVETRFAEEKARNEALTPIHCTTLAQRMTVAGRTNVRRDLAWEPSTTGHLTALRNALSHGRPFGRGTRLDRLRWAAEARELANRAWRLVTDRPQIWRAYAASDLWLGAERRPLTGPEAISWPWPGVVYGISGQNPFDQRLSERDNDRRHQRLLHHLAREAYDVGEAGANAWFENVVYVRLPVERALDLARRFGQRALFELDDQEVRIVQASDGAVRSRFPRCSAPAERIAGR